MANTDKFTVWGDNSSPTPSYGTYPAENGFSAGNPIYANDFNSLLRAYSLLTVALGQKLIPGVNANTNPITINDTLNSVITKLNWLPDPIANGLAWHHIYFWLRFTNSAADTFYCYMSFLWKNITISTAANLIMALNDILPNSMSKISCNGYNAQSNLPIYCIEKLPDTNEVQIRYQVNNGVGVYPFDMTTESYYRQIHDDIMTIFPGVSQ